MNELRYHPAGGTQRDAGHRTPHPAEGRDAVEVAELPLPVGSATFNIRRLDKMVAQHFHPERDADGRTALPQSSITKRSASVSAASSTSIRCRADALCPVLSGAQFFRYIHGYIYVRRILTALPQSWRRTRNGALILVVSDSTIEVF